MQPLSRRAFIEDSLTFAGTAALVGFAGFSCQASQSRKEDALRLGGPSFSNTEDPEVLALAHRKLGYRAAYCPNVRVKDETKVRAFAAAFAKHDVILAEVGRWCNLMDLDAEKRRKNIESVTDGLALAEAIGARCCVDIAGSFNPASWFGPHPKNFSSEYFDLAVENARKIIDAVKPSRTVFCYEMMGWAMPESPDRYLKMIKAVDRKAFGVHFDPCNLINSPEKFYDNTAVLKEGFDKLGRWIASCHAKDLAWNIEMNIHFQEVIPGKGSLDYTKFLGCLAKLPQNPPLMLEHLATPEDYAAARDYIISVGERAGLRFG
jgi:sugar phosphate isomerase/epimerase